MKEKLFWIIITALLVVTLIVSGSEKQMAIDFTNTADQKIDFGNSVASDLTQKSIVIWYDLDSFGDTATLAYLMQKWNYYFRIRLSTEKLIYSQVWTTGALWETGNNTVTLGKHLWVVTYDSSSTSNDPVFYIDGAVSAGTETAAPTGSVASDAAYPLTLGAASGTNKSHDGRLMDVRVYNRILSAEEVALIYSARGKDNIRNGLVFCPMLHGAKGLQVFDGAALAASNLIIDPCSGATGTPNGSPVGVGETYLSVK